jgi:glutamate carboxypeptidase
MDDPPVGRIQAYVADRADEQLRFVMDLCNQNSYTYNVDGTNLVAGMIRERLGDLLPCEETFRQEEVGDHRIFRTKPSSKGTYLLGHMDTVFPPDHPFQECTIDGEWLIGPGSGDMKGGLGVMVYAIKALHDSGALGRLEITFMLSADEEIGSVTSRSLYEHERVSAAACLVAECAGPGGEVVVSRNGKAGLRLDCTGEDRHVGRVWDDKSSAVLEMAHKVIALEALNGCLPGVTVNVGKIEGGIGPCTVPGCASALIDIRWLEEKHYEAVLGRVRDVLRTPACAGCESGITVLNHRPAMPATEASEALYSVLERAGQSVGIRVGREHRSGTSDANFFGAAGVPTLDGLGPVCHDDHTPRERIHIPSLAARTSVLAVLLAELGRF